MTFKSGTTPWSTFYLITGPTLTLVWKGAQTDLLLEAKWWAHMRVVFESPVSSLHCKIFWSILNQISKGLNIAGIMRWPKVIKPGTVSDSPTSTLDFLPTIRDLLRPSVDRVKAGRRVWPKLDGQSYYGTLKGTSGSEKKQMRMFRHYCGTELHSLRLVGHSSRYIITNIFSVSLMGF